MTPDAGAATRFIGEVEVAEPKARILVVDDNPGSVKSMAASLEALGEEVLTATSAHDALKHLLKHDVAVIVLDVMMPVMDGFQLAALIRQRERSRNTPIIFLTGLGNEDGQKLQGYRSGAADYITKPCDPEVLRFKVKIFVELAKKTEMLRKYAELVERKNQELQMSASVTREALERSLRTNAELAREIADRKRAEASRDRLAGQLGANPDFVEAMAEGAVTLALDRTILYCNTRFASMLGSRVEDLAGIPITRFLATASVEAFESLFSQARNGDAKAEMNLRAETGELVPVQIALNCFNRPELEAVAMVVTDLRDHRRNEEVLAQGNLARLILEYSMSGIAVCDPSGRVTLASAGLRQLCGRGPLFMPFDELFELTADDRPFSINEVLNGRVHTSKEVNFLRTDGRQFTLLLSAGPISGDNGNQAGCVVVLVDISEWKQVEETLRRSEKLAAAGRIAGTLAHEVNNPLTSVTNLMFLLEANQSLDGQAREYLALASTELARVSHIVRSTLAFYRESSAPVDMKLAELLDNIVELFSTNIRSKNLVLEKRYDYGEPVLGYPGETRQVVSNLVSNAIDAAPDGGRILLRVRRSRDWRTGREGVCIVVADSGNGISKEHRGKLFEPFFTTKGEKGTGLGLWVTQGIVQKHGGKITVRSSQEKGRSGTLFSVFLPVPQEIAGDALTARVSGLGQDETLAA